MKRSALLFGALMLGAASAANAQGLSDADEQWLDLLIRREREHLRAVPVQSSSGNTADRRPRWRWSAAARPRASTTAPACSRPSPPLRRAARKATPTSACTSASRRRCSAVASNHDCFGAQIDMRQVFLTVGGSWGTITAGKELGLYQRGNILNDQTLFGVGGGGIAPGGTTLGPHRLRLRLPELRGPDDVHHSGRPSELVLDRPHGSEHLRALRRRINIPRLEAEGSYKSGNIRSS